MFLETFISKQHVLLLLRVAFWQRVRNRVRFTTSIDALHGWYAVAIHLGTVIVSPAASHRLSRAHWSMARQYSMYENLSAASVSLNNFDKPNIPIVYLHGASIDSIKMWLSLTKQPAPSVRRILKRKNNIVCLKYKCPLYVKCTTERRRFVK